MNIQLVRKGFLSLLLMFLLNACDSEKMQETEFGIQQNYFLQSIELVESAGLKLQRPGLKKHDVELAIQQMDQGMSQAFEVERKFLRKLDLRLPKAYSELFISGVEQYRLGMENGNRQQQLQGLDLLSRWGQFWKQEKSNIQQKLVSMNG
jgi:hypothetical protein